MSRRKDLSRSRSRGRRHGDAVKTIDRVGHVVSIEPPLPLDPPSGPNPPLALRAAHWTLDAVRGTRPGGGSPIGLSRRAGRTAAPVDRQHKVTNDPGARDIGRSVTNPLNRGLLPSAEQSVGENHFGARPSEAGQLAAPWEDKLPGIFLLSFLFCCPPLPPFSLVAQPLSENKALPEASVHRPGFLSVSS